MLTYLNDYTVGVNGLLYIYTQNPRAAGLMAGSVHIRQTTSVHDMLKAQWGQA